MKEGAHACGRVPVEMLKVVAEAVASCSVEDTPPASFSLEASLSSWGGGRGGVYVNVVGRK